MTTKIKCRMYGLKLVENNNQNSDSEYIDM